MSCTIETPQSILGALQIGQWLTSPAFKDAYFHIGINPVEIVHLHFCHDNIMAFHNAAFQVCWQVRVFTKKVQTSTIVRHVCPHRDMPTSYIDNIPAHVLMPRVINLENLDFIPFQVATHLGILYGSTGHQTRGRLMVTNWLSIVEGIMASDESPPAYKLSVREWTQ